jgi:hypothetical protein
MSKRTAVIAVSGLALLIAFSGSAIAQTGFGVVTSKMVRNGSIMPWDLSSTTRDALQGDKGTTGAAGASGATGTTGAGGASGAAGTNGSNGANGPNGANGADGRDGTDGTNGTNGTNGTDGINGTVTPLFATAGNVIIPTSVDTTPVTVISLAVPAGKYVVLAKTQVSHSGAGDTVDCFLYGEAATIDRGSMKTMPALAAMPMSMQARYTTLAPATLSVACHVKVADGAANYNSLIAIPTG